MNDLANCGEKSSRKAWRVSVSVSVAVCVSVITFTFLANVVYLAFAIDGGMRSREADNVSSDARRVGCSIGDADKLENITPVATRLVSQVFEADCTSNASVDRRSLGLNIGGNARSDEVGGRRMQLTAQTSRSGSSATSSMWPYTLDHLEQMLATLLAVAFSTYISVRILVARPLERYSMLIGQKAGPALVQEPSILTVKEFEVLTQATGRMQARMQRFRERIRSRLTSRDERLQECKADLATATSMNGRLALQLSHELRGPLQGMLATMKLLERALDNPEHLKYCKKVAENGRSILQSADQILAYSRLDSSILKSEATEFSVFNLIDEIIDASVLEANRKGISLIVDVYDDVPEYIRLDYVLLKHVLLNLTGNSVKFTQAGNVRLTVKLIVREQPILNICVSDTGIGIPDSALDKIFEPFAQASRSISRTYGGTGLGLAICKRSVEALNGKLEISSELGRGTSVIVDIPFIEARHDEAQSNPYRAKFALIVVNSAASLIRRAMARLKIPSEFSPTVRSALIRAKEWARLNDGQIPLIFCEKPRNADEMSILFDQTRKILGAARVQILFLTDDFNPFPWPPQPENATFETVFWCPLVWRDIVAACDLKALSVQRIDETPSKAKLRFLVVDDQENVLELIAQVLLDGGHNVQTCMTVKDALDLLKSNHFDILIIDCQMPQMDGIAGVKAIRSLPRGSEPEIFIVGCSASQSPEDEEEFIALGADMFVSKPFERSTLRQVLERLVQKRPASPEISVPAIQSDSGIADDFLERCFASMRDDVTAAGEALTIDPMRAAAMLHRVAGLALQIKAQSIAEAAARGEALVTTGNFKRADLLMIFDLINSSSGTT